MDTSTIQIDGFSTNLHGCRILCQGPFSNGKYAPIMESIQKMREPFKKKILFYLISDLSILFELIKVSLFINSIYDSK